MPNASSPSGWPVLEYTRSRAVLRSASDVQSERAAIFVGEPADREAMRSHMPAVQSWVKQAWETFGGLEAVVGVEGGRVYRWRKP